MRLSVVADLILISAETPPSHGCDTLAVTYGVIISLSKQPELSGVIARDVVDAGRSWGLLVTGTDGQPRPVLVIDETRQMSLVMPLDSAKLPGVTSDGFRALGPHDDGQALVAWVSRDCDDEMTVNASRDVSDLVLRIELDRTGNVATCRASHVQGLAVTFEAGTEWDSVKGFGGR